VLILGNLVVGLMFALLTYYLAYFGATSPDRVVRVRLFKFMARVPMTATLVLLVFILAGRASNVLGLPTATVQAFAVVATVMVVEWAVHAFKQPLERMFHLNHEPDVARIQELSERLLTTRDMQPVPGKRADDDLRDGARTDGVHRRVHAGRPAPGSGRRAARGAGADSERELARADPPVEQRRRRDAGDRRRLCRLAELLDPHALQPARRTRWSASWASRRAGRSRT
jgi:hypothetical protein